MTRVRSTTTGGFDTVNVRSYKQRTSCAAAFVQYQTDTSYTGTREVKTIEDVVTPGFHTLLKCGRFLPLNPVDIITTTETRVPGSGTVYETFTGGCWKKEYSGPKWLSQPNGLALPAVDESIVNSVVTASVAGVREAIWDALTFIGEFEQTVDLFRTQHRRLNDFTDWLIRKTKNVARKRKLRNRRDLLRLFAELWLEYSFGWVPLMMDLENALEAFTRKVNGMELLEGKSSQSVSLDDSEVLTTNNASNTVTTTNILTGNRIYRGHAYGTAEGGRQRISFDPLTSTWELMPWSFVIDYFLDVGSWLQAYSPFSGAKVLGSMCSIKDVYTMEQEVGITYFNTQTGSFSGVKTIVEVKHYTRFPAEPGALPSWNPRLTPKRIVNLVALVIQGKRRSMAKLLN